MQYFSVGSSLTDNLSETNFLSAAGWTYLALGFSTGLVVLVTSGLSVVVQGQPYYDWTTVLWGTGLVLFSIVGYLCVTDLQELEKTLSVPFARGTTLDKSVSDGDVQTKRA